MKKLIILVLISTLYGCSFPDREWKVSCSDGFSRDWGSYVYISGNGIVRGKQYMYKPEAGSICIIDKRDK